MEELTRFINIQIGGWLKSLNLFENNFIDSLNPKTKMVVGYEIAMKINSQASINIIEACALMYAFFEKARLIELDKKDGGLIAETVYQPHILSTRIGDFEFIGN